MDQNQVLINEGISIDTALDFVTDGIIIVNSKLEILFINTSSRIICGMNPEGHYSNWPSHVGVYEKDLVTLYDPEKLPLVMAVRGETSKNHHLYLKNELLNEWKCVSCNAGPIRSGDKIIGAILSFRDITESVAKEDAVKMEREAYHKILNSLPAYVFTKDLEGNYTFLNEKFQLDFEPTFGVTQSSNKLYNNLISDVRARDALVIQSKEPMEFSEVYTNPQTGRHLHMKTTRIPLLDKTNVVYGICGISYDVTADFERKKELEEERTKIATASKLAALGMLAAELGHEINNPLAIIRTSSWIMRKILTSDNFSKDLAVVKLDEIDITIQRISDIVTSVKNLSRDSSQEKMQGYLLKDIIRDVQSICGTKFHSKSIEFKLDRNNPLLNETLSCYRVQLSEVLINLIVNAVDAVENLPKPWIKLEIVEADQNLIMRVIDSGTGVPEELEKKIFTPFFSTKEIGKGTGLGLSISKEIMKRHGGDLKLNRHISDSCFEVVLPFNKKES